MAHVTRIKAKDSEPSKDLEEKSKKSKKTDKPEKTKSPKMKKEKSAKSTKNTGKKPFILFRPFVAFGRYLRDSWRELRQVRWPNRKVTWKMVLAVFVYTAIFITFLVVVDILFDWLFSLILK
ncbi:preprotein translocase subunit SecE [Candidatus Saccharibacteria bacterium]|nr:preprotein translocase subunit SecE [Candidatus Saccharibacteria bacterium]